MSINFPTDYSNSARPSAYPLSSAQTKIDDATKGAATDTGTMDVVDRVEISPQAREALAKAQASKTTAVQSYPIGDGYSADGKTFDQIKQDMRALFDERSKTLNLEITTRIHPDEVEELFGDVTDRRTLFAVFGDETGTFTKAEKNVAYHLMWQMKNDMEFGPTRTRAPGDHFGPAKGQITFLEQASPEEKATFDWVEQRAVAQIIYDTTRLSHTDPSPSAFYERVSTGDEKIDSIIRELLNESLRNYSLPIGQAIALRDSDAYAQALEGFNKLKASDHTFTYNPSVTQT